MSTNSIRLNNVPTNSFKPTKLRIDSIGVGISEETNDTLRLTDTQHMIVGERLINANGSTTKSYGLIVDKEGIAVNTTVLDRANLKGQYAMYVDGSVFVNGAVVACNIIGPSNIGSGHVSGDLYWKMASFETDNIFYENKVTLGNDSSARSNAHVLNIVQSADRTINHAQISIQNTQKSQLRMGIVGTSNISPVVFNTTRGVPIEFHVGRDQAHFAQTYTRSYYEDGSNIVVPSEVPRYVSSNVPQLLIASDGVVGIRTSYNPVIPYQIRIPYPGASNVMSFPNVNEKMQLHVDGPLFASNILIQDYETGKPVNIDRLYVRREGVTFLANQIIPGPFANGVYTFQSNIAIAGDAEQDFQLKVHGAERITDYLQVDGFSRLNKIEVNDAVLLQIASFCNDVYMQRDVIVKEAMRLRGGLYTEVIDGDNSYWCNVQFTVAGSQFSNINYYGLGFTTPGRVGVGIDPRNDEVNNQLVVRKRFDDIYELELYDKSSSKLHKAAFIGHPQTTVERINDGSLIISTPGHRDPDFNRDNYYPSAPQNVYFFPGDYTTRTEPIVRQGNPPVLNVHHSKKVGILTYDPMYTMDVRGDLGFSGDIYNGNDRLGIWRDKQYPNIYASGGSNPLYRGIEYLNPLASNVGVNVQPDPRFGMVVAGKLKSVDGYYTSDNRIIVPWMDTSTSQDLVAAETSESMFTLRNIGIGIKAPSATVEMKNNYGRSTVLRLNSPDRNIEYTAMNQIQFAGINDPWIIQGNDTLRRLEFGFGPSNVTAAAKKAMWMWYNTGLSKHQVVVGGTQEYLNGASIPDPSASLHVDGGLSVNGNVSITGRYIVNGVALLNSNVDGASNQLTLNNDDVFIGGNRILLNPRVNTTAFEPPNMVAVNFTANRLSSDVENSSKAPFRVFNSDTTNPVITRFVTAGNKGLLELASTSTNRIVRMGFNEDGTFACQDASDRAYFRISTDTSSGQTYVAFNALDAPTASLHVKSDQSGSNMLRLTRTGGGDDVTGLAPQMEFEKIITTVAGFQTSRWLLHGPDASYKQKLSFRYGEGAIGNANELICFTNNGCIGVGKTNPEFALDVAATGKRGTLRLLNSTNDPLPQILLQSGSNEYGADSQTDYRIYSYSNEFIIDSVNTTEYKQLLHFNANGQLGIGAAPSSNYQVNIGGVLNVKQAILLDGSPLFDSEGSDAQEGFSIRAVNIFLRPRTEYGGGVIVNRNFGTSNLFHIFNGENTNMMVYDSSTNEAQVHFRTSIMESSSAYSMYRMAMSNQTFRLAHQPMSASNSSFVPDDYNGYCNVVGWGPSTRPTASNEYDMNLYGSLSLIGAFPSLSWKDDMTTITSSNQAFHIVAASGVGIGTYSPQAELHVLQSDNAHSNMAGLWIEQTGTATNLARFTSGGADRMVIRSNGNVGVGTTMPQASLHVIDTIRISDNTGYAKGKLLFGDANVGMGRGLGVVSSLVHANDIVLYNSTAAGSIGFVANGIERMRIQPGGNVGIGTTIPNHLFHVQTNTTNAGVGVYQQGTGDIACLTGASGSTTVVVQDGRVGFNTASPATPFHLVGDMTIQGSVVPSQPGAYDLGSLHRRWRDIYLEGSTIDLGGTKISRAGESEGGMLGDIEVRESTQGQLRSMVVNKIRLKSNNPAITQEVYLEQGSEDPFVFVSYDRATSQRVEYAPFSKSSASGGISIGVTDPAALLHMRSSNATQPTAIFDHIGSASNVFQVQSNGIDKMLVQRDGNVGIGTNLATVPFYVVGSNELPNTIARIHQRGGGDIMRLETTSRGVTTVFDGVGNVGIGTTIAKSRLHVIGEQLFDGNTVFRERVYAAKDVEVQGNTITHGDATTDSDIRLKTDLQRIENALDKVCSLTGYTFKKITTDRRSTGLIAQEVQDVLPEAVVVRDDAEATLGVAYGNMMGLIIEAIKELRNDMQQLKDIVLQK